MKIFILVFLILIIGTTTSSCFHDGADSAVSNNDTVRQEDVPAWETSVITPARVVSYNPEGPPLNDGSYVFSDPSKALGLPTGGGYGGGSTDVVSLGDDNSGPGGSIVLEFDKRIINGPGTDFKVFENTFSDGQGGYFIECAKVYLSENGADWYEFPNSCDTNKEINDPRRYTGLAGIGYVETDKGDPYSPLPEESDSGGDFFDLEDMTSPIKEKGFRYIKIIDCGSEITDPGDSGLLDNDSGFDLDAVVGINYN